MVSVVSTESVISVRPSLGWVNRSHGYFTSRTPGTSSDTVISPNEMRITPLSRGVFLLKKFPSALYHDQQVLSTKIFTIADRAAALPMLITSSILFFGICRNPRLLSIKAAAKCLILTDANNQPCGRTRRKFFYYIYPLLLYHSLRPKSIESYKNVENLIVFQ